MDTLIADGGDFGKVCLNSFVDRYLTVNNSGACALQITSAASSSAEFLLPSVASYPVVVGSGDSWPSQYGSNPRASG